MSVPCAWAASSHRSRRRVRPRCRPGCSARSPAASTLRTCAPSSRSSRSSSWAARPADRSAVSARATPPCRWYCCSCSRGCRRASPAAKRRACRGWSARPPWYPCRTGPGRVRRAVRRRDALAILRCGGCRSWREAANVLGARQRAGARLAALTTLLRAFGGRWRDVPLRTRSRRRFARGRRLRPGYRRRRHFHPPATRRPRRARLRQGFRDLRGIGREEQAPGGRLLVLDPPARALVRREGGGKLQCGVAHPRLREPAQPLEDAGGKLRGIAHGSDTDEEELLEGNPRARRREQRLAGRAGEEPAPDHAREPAREPPIDEASETRERSLSLAHEETERFGPRPVERFESERTERQLHGATPSSGPGRADRSRARRDRGCR